jgi:hypothetical protein
MKRAIFGVCLLLLSASVFADLVAQSRTPVTTTMARTIRRFEPTWRYVGGWCTCPPTVPEQVWRDNGTWDRKDKHGRREFVNVEIVKAGSVEETADWMRHYGGGSGSGSCLVESYHLGDEAYLFKCSRSFKSILNYRKGRFLVRVDGDSQTIVERFAKYAVLRLPAS